MFNYWYIALLVSKDAESKSESESVGMGNLAGIGFGIGKKLGDSDSDPILPNTALIKKSIFDCDIRLLCTILLCSTLLYAGSCFHVATEHVQLQLYWGLDYSISQGECMVSVSSP